jgi:hypothetical protein
LAESGIGLAVAQEHVACGRGRGHFTTIEGDQSPVGQAQRHEASATETRVVAINDTEGQRTGDGRINRIAPVAQGLQPRLGGHGIHGRNQTLRGAAGSAAVTDWSNPRTVRRQTNTGINPILNND